MNRSKKNSGYNPVTRMFENASGEFSTYAEARQKQWKCEKCGEMFASYRSLKDHKKDFHSY
jgi:transcription initiation factor IIE alpha subunit